MALDQEDAPILLLYDWLVTVKYRISLMQELRRDNYHLLSVELIQDFKFQVSGSRFKVPVRMLPYALRLTPDALQCYYQPPSPQMGNGANIRH